MSQEWKCDNCKKCIIGGICKDCGMTFTEYLYSKGRRVYGDAG